MCLFHALGQPRTNRFPAHAPWLGRLRGRGVRLRELTTLKLRVRERTMQGINATPQYNSRRGQVPNSPTACGHPILLGSWPPAAYA
jgi:hypothetical protein